MMVPLLMWGAILAGPGIGAPAEQDLDAATAATADCYKTETARLDDGISSTELIAAAVVSACSSHLDAMDVVFRRMIIEMVNAVPGLSQPEMDKIAQAQLAEKPKKMRAMLEQKALLAVRVERSRKNAVNATN
jgi:hypothetical protein